MTDSFEIKWSATKKDGQGGYHAVFNKGQNENLTDFIKRTHEKDLLIKVSYIVNGQDLETLINERHYLGRKILGHENSYLNTIGFIINVWRRSEPNLFHYTELIKLLCETKRIDKLNTYLEKKRSVEKSYILEELTLDNCQLFCCSQCGDRDCGYFPVYVTSDDNWIKWTFKLENPIEYTFDRNTYRNEFQELLDIIESSTIDK